MSFDFNAWIRQPSTLHGLGVIAGGVGAALAQVTTGNTTVDAVVAVCAYALVHLGIDDHSTTQAAVTAVTADLIHGAAPAQMIADAVPVVTGAAALFAPAATTTTTTVTPTAPAA